MIESATYSANLYTDNIRTAGMFSGADKSASTKSANSFHDVLNETNAAAAETETGNDSDENSFLSFLGGLLDVINPLQHLPVISTLYRHLTGDEISPMARIAGDTLYGGPIGAALGIANVVVEKSTGQDIGQNMLAMVTGDDDAAPAAENTMLAANTATHANNIIWSETPDATESLPHSAPTNLPTHAEMAGITEQADRSYEMPVYQARDYGSESLRLTALAFTTEDADEEITAQPSVQSDQVLQSQKTPAVIAGTAEPSELIANMSVPRDMVAARMAEALDKYAAMKRAGL